MQVSELDRNCTHVNHMTHPKNREHRWLLQNMRLDYVLGQVRRVGLPGLPSSTNV